MVVAILAPALLAGAYFGVQLLITLWRLPKLETPPRPTPAIGLNHEPA